VLGLGPTATAPTSRADIKESLLTSGDLIQLAESSERGSLFFFDLIGHFVPNMMALCRRASLAPPLLT
jgi:hypothetical protein